MKQPSWFVGVLLLSLLLLTACAHSESGTVATLDPNSWPTQPAMVSQITSTPFPTVDLSLFEPTPDRQAAVADIEALSTPSPTLVPPTATATATSAPIQTAATLAPTATPTATSAPSVMASVNNIGLNIRSGPGLGFDVVGELVQGEAVEIFDRDAATGWVNVRASNGRAGWVNPGFLRLEGSLDVLDGGAAATPRTASTDSVTVSQNVTVADSRTAAANAAAGGRLLLQLSSGGEIVILNRDGSNMRTLTTGLDPALSPDGNRVAFTRWDAATQGSLWVINTDGSGERKIMGGMRKIKSPSWSPDGERVAVNFQEGGRLDEVRVCHNLADGEPDINFFVAYDVETEVRADPDSPQGFAVYICWKLPPDPHWKLRIIDVDSTEYDDMPAGLYAFAPTWDPARPWRVVSTAGLGLVQTDVNEGTASPLTNDPADRGPVFSPDGQFIAVTYKQHDHWSIHRLNADGNNRVRLTRTPLYAVAEGEDNANNAAPAFSPDGSEIAFLSDRRGQWEVWVMNVDGSDQRPMFDEVVSARLQINYNGNDERAIRWGR